MPGSLAGRESTSKSKDHRWPPGAPGGIFFSPMRVGFFHPQSGVPGIYDAVQIILDLGFVQISS